METLDFMIVALLSLFISVLSLVLAMVNGWTHKTVVIQTKPEPALSSESEAQKKQWADLDGKLFNKP